MEGREEGAKSPPKSGEGAGAAGVVQVNTETKSCRAQNVLPALSSSGTIRVDF